MVNFTAMEPKISLRGAVPLSPQFRFREAVDWDIMPGENWAVAGPNGAGKSVLADILLRRIPLKEGSVRIDTAPGRPAYEAVRTIGFRDIYSIVDCREAYYQQRWNADGRAATPLAGTLFSGAENEAARPLFDRFGLCGALDKHIVSLSSGELRKLLVIRALAGGPEVVVIDNPFVGLDEGSRGELSVMLGEIAAGGRVQLVTLVSDPRDIHGWIDKVLPVKAMAVGEPQTVAGFTGSGYRKLFYAPDVVSVAACSDDSADYGIFARLEEVTVRYGEKVILEKIDWTVRKGEKWALLGRNGSGKSTLLSLLYGDNPQAYANRITLFDRRRGTGESIWDIKKRIGYLNSDIHSYYLKDISALEVVLSGFYDTVGLAGPGTDEQRAEAAAWLAAFGAGHLAGRRFARLSFGQQRLVMLARTFVKRPGVLILDEPMHGLDYAARRRAGEVIARYCASGTVTLIYVTHYREEIPSCVDLVKQL